MEKFLGDLLAAPSSIGFIFTVIVVAPTSLVELPLQWFKKYFILEVTISLRLDRCMLVLGSTFPEKVLSSLLVRFVIVVEDDFHTPGVDWNLASVPLMKIDHFMPM